MFAVLEPIQGLLMEKAQHRKTLDASEKLSQNAAHSPWNIGERPAPHHNSFKEAASFFVRKSVEDLRNISDDALDIPPEMQKKVHDGLNILKDHSRDDRDFIDHLSAIQNAGGQKISFEDLERIQVKILMLTSTKPKLKKEFDKLNILFDNLKSTLEGMHPRHRI